MKSSAGFLAIVAFLIVSFAAPAPQRASAADVYHGRDLAERWCAACHVTGPSQRQGMEAPPFDTIAKRDNLDTEQLANFLLEPHPKMPNMGLTRVEAADIAAYIKSLKK